MKSAYEKAMEKLEKEQGPTRSLSDEERQQLADIDKKYDARVAETRMTYESKIASAGPSEVMGLQEEMNAEISRIEDERAKEKDAVWNS